MVKIGPPIWNRTISLFARTHIGRIRVLLLDSRDSQFGVSEFPFVDWVPMAVNVLRLGQAMVKDPIPAAGPHERVLPNACFRIQRVDATICPDATAVTDAVESHGSDRLGESRPDSLTAERQQHCVRLELEPSPDDQNKLQSI